MKDYAVVTFGRFNPIHCGHDLLVRKMQSLAIFEPIYIFTSHTMDSKMNPLSYHQKLLHLKAAYHDPGTLIVDSDSINNPFQMLRFFNGKVKNLVWVMGSDRIGEFGEIFSKYHNHHDPNKALTFNSLKLIEAGNPRVSYSKSLGVLIPKVEHISGSLMRDWAKERDWYSFLEYAPLHMSYSQVWDLYRDVQRGLNGDIPGVCSKTSSNRKKVK